MTRFISRWGPPLIPLFGLALFLELIVKFEILPNYLVAAPSEVLTALTVESEAIWNAFFDTAVSAFMGFLLSSFVGVLIGVLLSSSRLVQNAFYPYAIFFQTVPIIAIAPLLVIWIGYGRPTVVASCFIVSIFPMIASTLSGMKSTDPSLVDLFRLFRARKLETLFRLKLPFAVPQILVGLKISAGLAVIGAIVGEFIAGGGLGGWIDVARTRQRVDQIFAAILLASVIGLLFVGIVNWISSALLKHWHPLERSN